jgi:hypothetical protein
VSPILVRPVREQLEHDRVIRQLQAKVKRKFDAGINPGAERNVPAGPAALALYPDLVLSSLDRGHRLQAVVEVETGESVNHLEALAEWAVFSRLRADFHLYVPGGMVDVARRLCEDNQIRVNEFWSYHAIGDQVRFTLVYRTREPAPRAAKARPQAAKHVAKASKSPAKSAKSATRAAKPATKSAAQSTAKLAASRRKPAARARATNKPVRKAARVVRRK